MAKSNVFELDGSMLEGGGQILRNATAYSCLLGSPIHIVNIRAGRRNPGLRPQHLTGLILISDLCNARLKKAAINSQEIEFYPSPVKAGTYIADTKTAGSVCLLVQVALPCLLFANDTSRLILHGGTNADMAPPIDFTSMIFKPIAEKLGINMHCDIKRRGYFPKGGGEVHVTCHPIKHIRPFDLTDRGGLKRIYGRAFVAGVLPIKVAHAMSQAAQRTLEQQYPTVHINIEVVKEPEYAAVGTATGIMIIAETTTRCLLAGSALGKRGVPAEKVGQEAADMLLNNLEHGGCVDNHLQDQVIILMALAKGKSYVRAGPITLHTETAIHVAQLLTTATFNVSEQNDGSCIIECDGIGLENPYL